MLIRVASHHERIWGKDALYSTHCDLFPENGEVQAHQLLIVGRIARQFGCCGYWSKTNTHLKRNCASYISQIITGFMATAYITLLMVIIHYLFDHEETQNPVDRVIIDGAARLWRLFISNRNKPSKEWSKVIESAVLMFSDQQLVTGIGVLVSGYSQIPCALSTYHWQIVVYLAWFSSLTHLTTLTALRSFFRRQPILAYWRIVFMGCTIILLATALGPTGYISQNFDPAMPALCLFSQSGYDQASMSPSLNAINDQDYPMQSFNWLFILVSVLFLLVSYVSRVINLFVITSSAAERYMRILPGDFWKEIVLGCLELSKSSDRTILRSFWSYLAIIMMAIYVIMKVFFELGQSMLWEVSGQSSCCHA
jgi:hypothetical protein